MKDETANWGSKCDCGVDTKTWRMWNRTESGSPKSAPTPKYQGIVIITGSTRSARRIPAANADASGILSKPDFKAMRKSLYGFNSIGLIADTPNNSEHPPGLTYAVAF